DGPRDAGDAAGDSGSAPRLFGTAVTWAQALCIADALTPSPSLSGRGEIGGILGRKGSHLD
ncbi:hypothetical protein NW837_13530, partial [Synechococcus sp. R6-10]|uniref:hypothetical protein n=1 Tax=Synechococcus sp. R6-10 TaxID=2291956 RepID=UPI0039C0B3EC